MLSDQNRRLLRRCVPPMLGGFLLLALTLGGRTAARVLAAEPGAAAGGGAGELLGLAGAGLVLLGALGLARARVGGRLSWSLALAALLWLGEVALRLDGLVGAAAEADAAREHALRLLLAGGAMVALAAGLPRLFEGDAPVGLRLRWSLTRWLFALQLAGCAALVLAGPLHRLLDADALAGLAARVAARTPPGLLWLAFALPFGAALLALLETARELGRRPVGMERL